MGNRNPLLECLGRYSKLNLALMLFDNQHDLSESIWRLAGRHIYHAMVADDNNCLKFIELVKSSSYDAVLYRQVENLTRSNQFILMDNIIKMTTPQKGKIIFTTDNFDRVETGLLLQVCKIKFRVLTHLENTEDEQAFFDFETVQKEVRGYF